LAWRRSEMAKLYEKIRDIDRRVVFLFIALSVIIPLLYAVRFPEFPTPMVKSVFDAVENLPEGSRVLISFDYDPASEPELEPMALAWMRHCALKKHKIFIMALWPLGQNMAEGVINRTIKKDFPDYEYGVDYINLGYKSGGPGVINVILTDFENMYPVEVVQSRPLHEFPIFKDVKNLKSMDLIINVSAGTPGLKEWIQFGSDPAKVPIIGGATAVQAPLLYPYYPKQLIGLLGGLKAAAEYEKLLGDKYPQYSDIRKNKGRIRMGAQAIAHMVIMAFIIIGNITFFIDRMRERKG